MTSRQPLKSEKLHCIAYYLGQFHPIPENDQFWGDGFTEWHSVANARPLYPGHRQPKLPGKFGFYDLRCMETLDAQITYANDIGINAFCFWHYWFSGKRLLHRPIDEMLKLDRPEFKFILGWANESWSGIWHGMPKRVLMEQRYDAHELAEHAEVLATYLTSGRYLEINGRFPFLIYKPRHIPHAQDYLGKLRERVAKLSGAELYIIGNWSPGRNFEFADPSHYGLDAAVVTPVAATFQNQFFSTSYRILWQMLRRAGIGPEIRDYKGVTSTLEHGIRSIRGVGHATVVTGWDNTPRVGRRGLVLSGYTKKTFQDAAKKALALEERNSSPILFVKSWNEWAEGNSLEPAFREQWSAGSALKEILHRD